MSTNNEEKSVKIIFPFFICSTMGHSMGLLYFAGTGRSSNHNFAVSGISINPSSVQFGEGTAGNPIPKL